MNTITSVRPLQQNLRTVVETELKRTQGLLRLAPCWVPRSFVHPGRRLKLHPDDLYAYGVHRGGIDERWFASTTEAANEGRTPDEGLSYVIVGQEKFTLKAAVAECGPALVGTPIWEQYHRWPVYSKFFDNMGPLPHHLHQNSAQAALVGREGKPEGYYFPPQHNLIGNNFPYTFFGLEPGTTKEQLVDCVRNWNKGDNQILALSKAYLLQPGTGWLVDPGILHAPGSLCTYEPQWGSDVFAMFQNLLEGRVVSRELLVKDVAAEHQHDPDYIASQVDWEANVDPDFKSRHFLAPIPVSSPATGKYVDRWIVYGKVEGKQYFTAKELTIHPGETAVITDTGCYGLICVQGTGTINGLPLSSPQLIRFNELTDDEYFCTADGARRGVEFANQSAVEPLVCLRYFGPEVNPDAPDVPRLAPRYPRSA